MSKYACKSPRKQPSQGGARAAACRACSGPDSSRRRQRGGFTILELVVVMGIAAVVGAITLGGFSQLSASQKRTICQTNLTQVYQACRLYQADYGAFPHYYPNRATDQQGAGLWSLYAFPDPSALNQLAAANNTTLMGYLKNRNSMHCPQDNDETHSSISSANGLLYNRNFLSYQTEDMDSSELTYRSIRTTDTLDTQFWKRQLQPSTADGSDSDSFEDIVAAPPANDTIVTWCPWHRTATGGREMDNVLFYDGSVQLLPRVDSDGFSDWKRKQKSG